MHVCTAVTHPAAFCFLSHPSSSASFTSSRGTQRSAVTLMLQHSSQPGTHIDLRYWTPSLVAFLTRPSCVSCVQCTPQEPQCQYLLNNLPMSVYTLNAGEENTLPETSLLTVFPPDC